MKVSLSTTHDASEVRPHRTPERKEKSDDDGKNERKNERDEKKATVKE